MRGFVFSILSLIYVVIAGCSGIFQRAPLTLDETTAAAIRFRIDQNSLKYRSMKASADISVESPRMNFTASSQVFLKKPDSLLITIRGPFGIGVGAVLLDKDQFLAYSSFNNSVYTGDPQKLALASFLPIQLRLDHLIQAVSGIQLLESSDQDSIAIDHNKYLIIGKQGNQLRKYWIDPNKAVITEFQLWQAEDEPLLKIDYKRFEQNNQVYLPKFIQIYQPKQNTRITILYTRRETNCKLSAQDFSLRIPEQAERIEL